MHVIIVGAGVIGVTSAWYLSERGFEVTVVERRAEPAAETSFANGGQVSTSHAEPWANPGAPLKLLRWLARGDSPLLFRPRADPRQWIWLARFLLECTPRRTRNNLGQLVRLGLYSRAELQSLRRATGIHYDEATRGILHFYTDAAEFSAAREPARLMSELGCERRLLEPDEAIAIEPALSAIRGRLAGATYTAGDESGDACAFTRALAERCRQRGVRFLTGHRVTALRARGPHIDHAEVIDAEGAYRPLRADRYLLAAGSWSPLLAATLGLRLRVYPAKGYSLTMPVADPEKAWRVSLTDDEGKLVFSRLGERLRIAGTAELSGWNQALNPARCDAILRRTQQLFPGAGDASRAQYWSGLRPATPSNLPCLGATRYPELWLNTGHGTLGWTLACGSGRAIAELMNGKRPEVDFVFTR
ncbi:MAG TPA: D-amino acid dehydrogenase [Burkholderiaceae bacterium]|nr:D-amino acid dehydrogenase [Burkholderiaceae bacterium]